MRLATATNANRSRRSTLLLLAALWSWTPGFASAQSGFGIIPDPTLDEHNDCFIATMDQINECNYRRDPRGSEILDDRTKDLCFQACKSCCGVHNDFRPADKILFVLTCECLQAAGITALTQGAGAKLALEACSGARFWVEQVPTLIKGLKDVPGISDYADWALFSENVDHLVNLGLLALDLADLIKQVNHADPRLGQTLWDLLTDPMGADGRRRLLTSGGSTDWKPWASWAYGAADWIIGACDNLQAYTNTEMIANCVDNCGDKFPLSEMPGGGGGPLEVLINDTIEGLYGDETNSGGGFQRFWNGQANGDNPGGSVSYGDTYGPLVCPGDPDNCNPGGQ